MVFRQNSLENEHVVFLGVLAELEKFRVEKFRFVNFLIC